MGAERNLSGTRQIIYEESEQESDRDIRRTAGEKGRRKCVLVGLIPCEPMRWVTGGEG